MSYRKWLCCFISILAIAVPLRGVAEAGDLSGKWATQGFGSIVEISTCEESVCGRIIWLWDAEDNSGGLRRDRHNPEAGLRDRLLNGIEILQGFTHTGDGVWRRGRVYNPDDGRTYSGQLQLIDKDTLELTGCALRIFCQTQRWHRFDSMLKQLNAVREQPISEVRLLTEGAPKLVIILLEHHKGLNMML